ARAAFKQSKVRRPGRLFVSKAWKHGFSTETPLETNGNKVTLRFDRKWCIEPTGVLCNSKNYFSFYPVL
ncbi:MAG: hypothetical protein ACXVB1_13665, partial [Pseudobdellovibrionaceae bacterium]